MGNGVTGSRRRGGRWVAATALALVGLLAMTASAAADGGSAGSSVPPETTIGGATWYQVSTPAELEYIDQNPSGYLNANIELMGDVSLSGYAWTPFGGAATCLPDFGGTFNGNGYSITGLSVTDATDDCVGFFGATSGTVENLTVGGSVVGTSTNGSSRLGGLVGEQEGGTITDSSAAVAVTGNLDISVGGLVGYQLFGTIEAGVATGTVTASDFTPEGGLVGLQNSGTIETSYATGDVTTTTPSSTGPTAGLVGETIRGTIEDSYATGAVPIDDGAEVGGLIGLADGETITASFFLLAQSDEAGVGLSEGYSGSATGEASASALTAAAQAAGWNFATIWGTSALLNGGFPYLQWQFPPAPTPSTPPPPTLTTGSVAVGSGTASVIENMGYNGAQAIANGTSAGYVEERTALADGATFGGEGTDSSYLSDILSGTGVDLADPNVSPEEQGTFAALYQKLGIIPTWTDNTVSIGAGVAALEKAKASDLAMENYLVQLDGFTWAAAEAEAGAGFPIGQAT